MKIISGSALALMLVACSPAPSDMAKGAKDAPTGAAPVVVAGIDASDGSIADLRTGMTKDQPVAAGHAIIERSVMQEGDEYVVMDVLLQKGLVVECWFEAGRIDRLRTTGEGVKDEKGVGVGSTLAALKTSYPDGQLVTGNEDGRQYANFVNRSKVVFQMDMDALLGSCFDEASIGCDAPPDLRVRGVVVNSGPSS